MTAKQFGTFLLLLALSGSSALTQQGSPQLPNGAISGVVVDGGTGSPLAEVIVALTGATFRASYQTRQVTDARGRFVFMNVPDGEAFVVTAVKFGYLDGGYGRDTAPTDPLRTVVVRNGAWVGNLKVPIWKPSVISGTVRDERGEPIVGVLVRALARVRVAGREELAVGPLTVTDDHGQYRLSGLMPGRYLIQVPSIQMSVPNATRVSVPSTNFPEGAMDVDDTTRLVIGRFPLPPPRMNGRAMAYTTAFHPNGSSLAQASPIDLKFGDDRAGADVTLTPVAAVRVTGQVDGPPESFNGLTLRLLPAGLESLGLGGEIGTALVAPDGSFIFINVPAGTYTLDAPTTFNEFSIASGPSFTGGSVGFSRAPSFPNPPPSNSWSRNFTGVDGVPGLSFVSSDFRGGNAPNFSGRTSITVGTADVNGVVVRMRPLGTMRGRIVVEPDPTKPPPAGPLRFFFTLDPASGQPGLGIPRGNTQSPSLDFVIPGIQPGEYFFRLQSGPGTAVKSIQWRGREYANAPFDASVAEELSDVVVTVTTAVPTLTGTVQTADGAVPESGLVVVFPTTAAQRVNTGFTPTLMKSASLLSNGSFRFTSLPAGDYLMAAIPSSRLATWRDPAFLATLERLATRVTLSWGQTTTQNLTMAGVR